MAVTPAQVRALSLSSEFDADPPFSDAAIQLRIDRAALLVDTGIWGTATGEEAIANLAAHFLLQDKAGGSSSAAGPVTQRKVGEVSESYASTSYAAEDAQYASTSYGKTYLMLRDTVPAIGTTATSHAKAGTSQSY